MLVAAFVQKSEQEQIQFLLILYTMAVTEILLQYSEMSVIQTNTWKGRKKVVHLCIHVQSPAQLRTLSSQLGN